MLVYKNIFTVDDVEEGSLLFPTVNTVYLSNKEAKIIMKVHRRVIYLEKIFKLEVRIANYYEHIKNQHVCIDGIFNRVVYVMKEEGFKFELVHEGFSTFVTLPIKYSLLLTPKEKVGLSVKVLLTPKL